MPLNKRSATWVVLAAGAIWVLAGISVASGMPSKASPYPLAVVIPAFVVAEMTRGPMPFLLCLVAAMPVVICFLLWAIPLLRGSAVVPLRSIALFALVGVLCAIDLIGSWPYGLKYQGREQTVFVVVVNVAVVTALLAVLVIARRAPAFRQNLAFHALLFAWLGWCAFPYLGEMP